VLEVEVLNGRGEEGKHVSSTGYQGKKKTGEGERRTLSELDSDLGLACCSSDSYASCSGSVLDRLLPGGLKDETDRY
jgi:hypothetical protein